VNDKETIQNSPPKRRAEFLKTAGVAVLVLGFVTASIVYLSGENRSAVTPEPTANLGGSWKDGTLSPEDLKGSSRTIEMNFGKVAVLLSNWLHRWEDLKPHQLLAVAIAIVAVLLATYCFLAARRLLRERI
jgi:hypothetical protein